MLKLKAEVGLNVKNYVEKVKNLKGRKLKIVRSNRGGGYMQKRLQGFIANEGIQYQTTVGYAPQQSGTSECKNRTLMEVIRTVLYEYGLQKSM